MFIWMKPFRRLAYSSAGSICGELVHCPLSPNLIDNVVHGCFVEAVRVGATLKSGCLLGRVYAQFSLHLLMRMRMGVGVGSGLYKVGSGDILFMESALNNYVCCCFSKWYVQLLCVHYVCVRCICPIRICVVACCVCIGVVVFARSAFV